ncbi:Putative ribonuclease H protein At1g65750 [Linum perenne]
MHWVNASKFTNPKSEGGLGFKDIMTFNLALLAKQGWRVLHENDQLWAQIFNGIYFIY